MLRSDKPKEVERLKKMIDDYKVVGLLNMHALPARQLQKIRDKIRDMAVMKMSKKSLIGMAFDQSSKDHIKEMKEKIVGEPALIFTNENPFRLFKILKENRSPAQAKPGEIATKDIVIPKGSTGLPPGPAISTLQKIGLKTSVQAGKIAVMEDKVVVKANDKVSEDVVSVLNLLKIEPMEIGLDLTTALEGGTIYSKDNLDIDVDDYINKVGLAVNEMVNLSINTGYLVPSTAELSIQKAFIEAKSLALEANIIDKNIIDELLIKAIREADEINKLVHVSGEESKKSSEDQKPKEEIKEEKK